MQTYAMNLAGNPHRVYSAPGDLFVYESGVNGEAGETRIIVKPDSGGEVTLRPGQRFRLGPNEKATQWMVRAFDNAAPIVGAIIIGAGEFDDANTLNKVQLDATFANVVKVNNTDAERVPVSLNPNDVINTSEAIMSWTHHKKVDLSNTTPVVLVAAAENTNGVIIEQVYFVSTARARIGAGQYGQFGPQLVDVMTPEAQGAVLSRRRTRIAAGLEVTAALMVVNGTGTIDVNWTRL